MSFLYPSVLWVLLPLGILLWHSHRAIVPLVHTFILCLLVIALARPIEEQVLQKAHIQAKEIIIALDVSYSMRADDIKPTRYAFAKETIVALFAKNPSDNIMLLAFTSNPLLLSPPTTDHALIAIALESLNPDFILTKGTSLQKLFDKVSTLNSRDKSLILLSDGGEESDIEGVSAVINTSHIALHILALGSKEGRTIRKQDGTILKDKEGNLVISRINPLLKSLARSVGASYTVASSTPQATADALDIQIRQEQLASPTIAKMHRYYLEYYSLPLGVAMLLFLMLHTRGVKYMLMIMLFLGMEVEASFMDNYHLIRAYSAYEARDYNSTKSHLQKIQEPSLQSQMALANSYYQQGNFKQALALYLGIQSTSVTIKQVLYYNIATSYSMMQEYAKAKIYYMQSLQLVEESDALYNLGLIALLTDTKEASLGIAHPKSQSDASSKSESAKDKKDVKKAQEEDKPSSGSGAGEAQNKQDIDKDKPPSRLLLEKESQEDKHPLSSKVYELINKGYIRETQPW
ncbi:MAG: VWA domain-containing protein [Sulfurovum sp.]|nr:VWA domain-containing protein [Sulfurovum sp.]